MQAQGESAGDKRTVSSRLHKLLDDKKWTDIRFMVGTEPNVETVEAHRVVIAAASPVFEAMSFGGLAEGEGPVKVPDISPAAFKAMLKHMYTNAVELTSVEAACDVLQAARKYLLAELMDECSAYLKNQLSPTNACLILEASAGEKVLSEASLAKIRNCTDKVLARPDFVHVSWETLDCVLDQNLLELSSEVTLLDASLRWAQQRCEETDLDPNRESLRSALGAAFCKIRFLTMTAAELVGSASFEKLLTDEEARKILANIAKQKSCQLPGTICSSVKNRCNRRKPIHEPLPHPTDDWMHNPHIDYWHIEGFFEHCLPYNLKWITFDYKRQLQQITGVLMKLREDGLSDQQLQQLCTATLQYLKETRYRY